MATRKQRQQVKRKARRFLIIERRYARQIGRLYRKWFNDWLPRIMARVSQRIDALWDELAPLFVSMARDWADRVQRFATEINEVANDVAAEADPFLDAAMAEPTLITINLEPSIMQIVRSFSEENAALITKIGQETADKVQLAAVSAIEFGDTPDELTKKIRKIGSDFEGYRARLIARDQVGKLQGQIHMQRMQDAGLDRYEWMTVGDNRVRDSHKALDGTIRTWNQAGPKPGQEIQCRCQPVTVLEDIL